MGSRHERVARNETLFREVNERIRELTTFGGDAEFLCECGDAGCVEPVSMSLAEYERVREEASRFFVRAGHEAPDIEEILVRTDRYTIVSKENGVPAEIAVESDPRD